MANKTEKTIQRLADMAALEKLINDYHWRADNFDWKGWADSFTKDAEFELPDTFGMMRGRKEIHDICKGNMDHVYGAMQHVMVNLDFDITGKNSATGHGNLIFTAIPDPEKPSECFTSGGRYNWEFTRTGKGWKISRARLVFLWNNGQDTADVFASEEA
ncbi:MAG: nuclear transport factor 2 family protein [Gammaproteobacteria bacterium]|nr:nuclear transport factor 2 family protein [Gammaproteobacteria bacterium]